MEPERVLDLFCGAGGAAMGLHRAWPKAEIIGIDNRPQPRYPFEFIQMDWEEGLNALGPWADFIWASPPCQRYSAAQPLHGKYHLDLIGKVRDCLGWRSNGAKWISRGQSYVIENVMGAPLLNPVLLCGLSLGCRVKRHRLFETNFHLTGTKCIKGHPGDWLIVFGWTALRRSNGSGYGPKKDQGKTKGKSVPHEEAARAMGIDWMAPVELSQAIPPAYSEYIARQYSLTCAAGLSPDTSCQPQYDTWPSSAQSGSRTVPTSSQAPTECDRTRI